MMKKLNMKIWAGAMAIILLASSCDDFLDVNTNPNQAITSTPALTLPAAIVGTASISSQYNSYGGHFGGIIANAGGFSGFGTLLSYNLTPSDYNGLWVNTYQDPLRDLKFVLDATEGDSTLIYLRSAAQIMMVYNYQKLVDTFGDVPYSQALQGDAGNLTPGYDDAAGIYADLLLKLDEAVNAIIAGQKSAAAGRLFPIRLTLNSDPLFGPLPPVTGTAERAIDAQLLDWKRFAKTLKLKLLVRSNAPASAFNDPQFDPAFNFPNATDASIYKDGIGFITDDAIVDPGYELNRPNPAWATWGRTVAGALSNSSRIPTKFSYGFFAPQFDNGQTLTTPLVLPAKLTDTGRGQVIFNGFNQIPTRTTTTPTNQLGNEVGNPPILANQVTWAGSVIAGRGVLKGPAMGQPLILLAEAKFLVAEALLTAKLTPSVANPDYTTAFNQGILASFTYLYKDEAEVVGGGTPATLVTTYQTANNAGNNPTRSYLANIGDATTDAQRLEAIITQKYIAVMMIHSDEGYNEYRRTGYPVSVRNGASHLDIASNKSTITTRPDALPTRVMYPSSEASYNSANYRDIDYRTAADLIFWDPN